MNWRHFVLLYAAMHVQNLIQCVLERLIGLFDSLARPAFGNL